MGSVVLRGATGAGKTLAAATIAHRLGYAKVAYFTEAGLKPPVYKDIEFIKISYGILSKRLARNSNKCRLETAAALIAEKGIDTDTFLVLDEVQNIKNCGSSRSKMWLAIRFLLKDNALLLMSGTVRSTNNCNLVPILYSCGIYARGYLTYEAYLKAVKDKSLYYTAEIPLPQISKHATRKEDRYSEELKAECEHFFVDLNKTKQEEITLYETLIELPMNELDRDFLQKCKNAGAFKLRNNRFVPFKSSTFDKYFDGFVEIYDPLISMYEPDLIKHINTNMKLQACDKLVKKHNKIIIITQFQYTCQMIQQHYGDRCVDFTVDKDAVTEFKTNPDITILTATLTKISTGHDIDEGDAIIYYSVPARYEAIEQSYARVDRLITTRDKYYYWLCYDWKEKAKTIEKIKKVEESMIEWGFGKDNFHRKMIKYEDL